jgi:outer membrane protein OmpA-like peptidoglycan-associated protein
LEYAFYRQKVSLSGFSDAYDTYDMLGNPIVYHTRIDNYSEKQLAGLLNIPLSVLYQTGNNHQFYASLGAKLGLPVSAKYSGSNTVLNAEGYYPDYDQTEIWQNDLGYGKFQMTGNNGKLDLGVSFSGTMETGVKWNIGIGKNLYTGVFVDYGFNNMQKTGYSGKRFIEYNPNDPSKPIMNTACVLSDRFSPVALGIKVKLAFSVGCRDLLNDRKAYKAMQSADNNFSDFNPTIPKVDTVPPAPVVVSADAIKKEGPEKMQQPDSSAIKTMEAERLAYMEAAKERRQKYSQSLSTSSVRDMDNYNLGIVTLTAEQKSALDDYVGIMTENPSFKLDITGHTCDLGTDELNMRIGQERADLAKDYMVEKGISPSRIRTFSKGETEPLFPNNNEVNRKKNRRLEIVVKK